MCGVLDDNEYAFLKRCETRLQMGRRLYKLETKLLSDANLGKSRYEAAEGNGKLVWVEGESRPIKTSRPQAAGRRNPDPIS